MLVSLFPPVNPFLNPENPSLTLLLDLEQNDYSWQLYHVSVISSSIACFRRLL